MVARKYGLSCKFPNLGRGTKRLLTDRYRTLFVTYWHWVHITANMVGHFSQTTTVGGFNLGRILVPGLLVEKLLLLLMWKVKFSVRLPVLIRSSCYRCWQIGSILNTVILRWFEWWGLSSFVSHNVCVSVPYIGTNCNARSCCLHGSRRGMKGVQGAQGRGG